MFANVALSKTRLDVALGPRISDYWHCFRSFVTGKMTKSQWDEQALRLLGPDLLRVHNEFVLAIFLQAEGNNSSNGLEPVSKMASQTLAIAAIESNPPASKKEKPAATISLADLPFTRSAETARSSALTDDLEVLAGVRDAATAILSSSAISSGSMYILPGVAQIRAHLYIALQEADLAGVAEDVSGLIGVALENYLKNILDQLFVARRCRLKHRSEDHLGAANTKRPVLDPVVTLDDVNKCLRVFPSLFGEQLVTTRERVLASMY